MLGLSCALAAVLAAPGGLADGTWLPTRGGAGERLISAVAGGGDGALYAAGAGQVWRLVPGDRWRSLGVYAPRLSYDGDRVDASGENFSVPVLEAVAEDASQYVEGHLDDFDDDTVADLLVDFVSESDTDSDSPFRLAGIVPSTAGVWLGTGVGVFWADAKGVTGPIGTVTEVRSLTATPKGLAVIGAGGLYAVEPTGKATPLAAFVPTDKDQVASVGDQVVLLAGGELKAITPAGPRALRPPTGRPEHIVSDGELLWIRTPLALFRWQADAWHLCGAAPTETERLAAGGGQLVMVGEFALTTTDRECATARRILPPWPGGLVMTDAALFAGALWGASTEGVFLYAAGLDDGQESLRVEKLRRDMDKLPRLDALVRRTFRAQRIDRRTTSLGVRPLWSNLLPLLIAQAWTRPERVERDVTLVSGGDQLTVREPAFEWRIALWWTIRFDGLANLFGGPEEIDEIDILDNPLPIFDEAAWDDLAIFDTMSPDEIGFLETFAVVDIDDSAAQATQAGRALGEQRQLRRTRDGLRDRVAGLYRQRLRLMRQLSQADTRAAIDVVLEMEQIDAELNALSGGMFARHMRGADGAREEEP